MYISKAVYSLIGILLSIMFFFTADTIYGYCCAVGALFGAIYVWLIKRIVKGDIIDIKICDDEKVYENLLTTEDINKIKALLQSEKASFNLDRDYMFSKRYLLIVAERTSCRVYCGINTQGDKVLKINNKWYEIETDEDVIEEIANLLR